MPNSMFYCDCPTGMKLDSTNKTCTKSSKNVEIYFIDEDLKSLNYLTTYIDQEGFQLGTLSIPSNITLNSPDLIGYDSNQGLIYWTDTRNKKVMLTDF